MIYAYYGSVMNSYWRHNHAKNNNHKTCKALHPGFANCDQGSE